jgi:hypothetical protein
LKIVASELAKYKLDLMAVQEVSGNQAADDYTLFYGNRKDNHHLRREFFVHKAIISAVQRVELINGRMTYVTQRGHWYECAGTI